MVYGEQRGTGRGTYYRGRYKTAPGKYATLPERFRTKTAAKQAADEAEAGSAPNSRAPSRPSS
jgi:hypothetical protein